MNTIQELQKLREELIREIDEKFDWIIGRGEKRKCTVSAKREPQTKKLRDHISVECRCRDIQGKTTDRSYFCRWT